MHAAQCKTELTFGQSVPPACMPLATEGSLPYEDSIFQLQMIFSVQKVGWSVNLKLSFWICHPEPQEQIALVPHNLETITALYPHLQS